MKLKHNTLENMRKELAKQAKRRHLVFVYGTLLRDNPSRGLIYCYPNAKFVAKDSMPGYKMYDRISSPAVYPGAGVVHGEVYLVDDLTLMSLDDREGHPFVYVRVKGRTTKGYHVFTYIWTPERLKELSDLEEIKTGKWQNTQTRMVWREIDMRVRRLRRKRMTESVTTEEWWQDDRVTS